MRKYRFLKALKFVVFGILACALFGFIVLHLWNWLMPAIFHMQVITFWQALGLLILSKLLFGGFHRHGGRGPWRRHMQERWASMTPEQQEKFRAGMRGRRGCGFGSTPTATAE